MKIKDHIYLSGYLLVIMGIFNLLLIRYSGDAREINVDDFIFVAKDLLNLAFAVLPLLFGIYWVYKKKRTKLQMILVPFLGAAFIPALLTLYGLYWFDERFDEALLFAIIFFASNLIFYVVNEIYLFFRK